MDDSPIHVLLVEDDPGDARLLREMLRESPSLAVEVVHVERLDAAREHLRRSRVDVVLLDLALPDSQGLATVAAMLELAPAIPVIVLTGLRDEEVAVAAMRDGAQDYLIKGDIDARALTRMIRYACERKRTAQALVESERRYRNLVQGLHDGVFVCDAENRIIEATDPLGTLLGYRAEELIGLAVSDLVDPADLASAPLRRQQLERTGRLVSERVLRRRDGTPIPVEVASVQLGDGRVECIVRDVTERIAVEQVERLLAEAGEVIGASLDMVETTRSIARLLVPRLADWCVIDLLDEAGELQVLEVHAADPEKEALLYEMQERFPHHVSSENHPVGRVLHSGEPLLLAEITPTLLERVVEDPDHREMVRRLAPRSSMVVPLVAGGRILGVMTLSRTEPARSFGPRELSLAEELGRRAALAIEHARLYRQARQALRSRDEVLSFVAHDLRNPLSAVSMSAALLLDIPLSEEQRVHQLEAVLRAADQMDRLIQDLLDVSRIESGRMRVETEPLLLGPVLSEARATIEARAAARELTIVTEVVGSLMPVQADRQRILQVLSNLLGNAVKFTRARGTISLRAEARNGEVLISVRDSGIGIPAEQMAHLFDRFWQGGGTSPSPHGARSWCEPCSPRHTVSAPPEHNRWCKLASEYRYRLRQVAGGEYPID
jgi:PAS domain S-box-containing protein